MEKCFIHVKIKSCQEATDIQLRLEGASPVPLYELNLDISEEGNEQDVCLPVPCKDGQLTESMKLKATSIAGSSLNIDDVSPEKLDTDFRGLQEDSADCFGDASTPGDINITCKEQQPGQCVDIMCMFINADIFNVLTHIYK